MPYPSKDRIDAKCNVCGVVWKKRRDSFIGWDGHCRSCAQRILKNEPELKAKMCIMARNQVLKQGGIRNARHFTVGSTKGPLNARWKGGERPTHTGASYSEWRKKVYLRDSFSCQICGQVGTKLNAHHIKAFADFPALRYEVDNGVTLCEPCHKEVHKKLRRSNV